MIRVFTKYEWYECRTLRNTNFTNVGLYEIRILRMYECTNGEIYDLRFWIYEWGDLRFTILDLRNTNGTNLGAGSFDPVVNGQA